MSVEDGFCSLMHPDTCDTKDDLKAPEGELGAQVAEAYEKASADGTDVLVGYLLPSKIIFQCFSKIHLIFMLLGLCRLCLR